MSIGQLWDARRSGAIDRYRATRGHDAGIVICDPGADHGQVVGGAGHGASVDGGLLVFS